MCGDSCAYSAVAFYLVIAVCSWRSRLCRPLSSCSLSLSLVLNCSLDLLVSLRGPFGSLPNGRMCRPSSVARRRRVIPASPLLWLLCALVPFGELNQARRKLLCAGASQGREKRESAEESLPCSFAAAAGPTAPKQRFACCSC